MPKRENEEEKRIKEQERKKAFLKNVNSFLNKNFKWFIVLVVIIIFTTGYFYLLKPKYEQTQKVLKIINQKKESDYQTKKKHLEKIKNLLLAYSKIRPAYIEKINSIAPTKNEELFTKINQLISNQGLLVQSLDIQRIGSREPQKNTNNKQKKDYLASGDLGAIKINVNVRGTDYESFKKLLYAIENNLRLIDVQKVSFNPEGQSSQLVLLTYYTKEFKE